MILLQHHRFHCPVGGIDADHDAEGAGDEDGDAGEESGLAQLVVCADGDGDGDDAFAAGLDDVVYCVVEVCGIGEPHGGFPRVGLEAAGDVGDVEVGEPADDAAAEGLHFLFDE